MTQQPTKPTHGGLREGAGRKRAPEPLQTVSITLYTRQVEALRRLNQNISEVLRKLIDAK